MVWLTPRTHSNDGEKCGFQYREKKNWEILKFYDKKVEIGDLGVTFVRKSLDYIATKFVIYVELKGKE